MFHIKGVGLGELAFGDVLYIFSALCLRICVLLQAMINPGGLCPGGGAYCPGVSLQPQLSSEHKEDG